MEPLWSPVVATGGNRSQIGHVEEPPQQAKTVAVRCDRSPEGAHGKEEVDLISRGMSSGSKGAANASNLLRSIDLVANQAHFLDWPEVDELPRNRPQRTARFGDSAPRPVHFPVVYNSGNDASRADPAGGRRKLPLTPANPRNVRGGKACSCRESTQVPAQPGSAMTGLSRRKSRVRVPSLP
jgi:hypothetical protein